MTPKLWAYCNRNSTADCPHLEDIREKFHRLLALREREPGTDWDLTDFGEIVREIGVYCEACDEFESA